MKTMTLKALICATAALAAAPLAVQAETLDLSLGGDSVAAALNGPLRNARSNAAYDLGFLYSDDRDADLKQAHAGLLVTGDAGARGAKVNAGLGLRAVAADLEPGSGGAVNLGGRFELRLPDFNRLGFTGSVWYAPEIISFGDFESNLEYSLLVDYQVIREAAIFAGYREVRYDIEDHGEDRADDSLIAGLRLQF